MIDIVTNQYDIQPPLHPPPPLHKCSTVRTTELKMTESQNGKQCKWKPI